MKGNVRRMQIGLEPSCQREEEPVCDDFGQGVWDRSGALLLDLHPRGKCAGSQNIGAGESICGFEGRGLEDGALDLVRGSSEGFLWGIEVVEFGWQMF